MSVSDNLCACNLPRAVQNATEGTAPPPQTLKPSRAQYTLRAYIKLNGGTDCLPVQVQGATVLGLVDILEEFWSLVLQHGIPQNLEAGVLVLAAAEVYPSWQQPGSQALEGCRTQHACLSYHGQVEDTSNRPKLRGFSDESTGPFQRADIAC